MYSNVNLPNFVVIGAQKAGSSWINKKLRNHPEIFMPKALEVHYFNRANCEDPEQQEIYSNIFNGASAYRRVGEKTPSYFWTSGGMDDSKTLSINHNRQIPSSIKRILGPKVQLIVSLRHPIARAISAYGHHIQRKRIIPNTPLHIAASLHGILDIGFYDRHLINYFKDFDQHNFFICTLEGDIKKSPEKLLNRISKFLGVSEDGFIDEDYGSVNSGHGKPVLIPDFGKGYDITPHDISYLLDAYSQSIVNTSNLLGGVPEWDKLTREYESFASQSLPSRIAKPSTHWVKCFISVREYPDVPVSVSLSTRARIDPESEKIQITGTAAAPCHGKIIVKEATGRIQMSELPSHTEPSQEGVDFTIEATLKKPAKIGFLPTSSGRLNWIGEISATGVIEGNNGWLFLHNDGNKSLQQRNGNHQASDGTIRKWGKALSKAKKISGEEGIKWCFLIAPSKEDVAIGEHPVPQFLPQSTDRLVEAYSQEFPLVDVRGVLKPIYNIAYSKNDTHWTFLGARISAMHILEKLEIDSSLQQALYELPIQSSEIRGDLGDKIIPRKIVKGSLPDEGRMDYEKVFDNDFRVGHGRVMRFRNSKAPVDKRCLILGGSSSFWIFPWMASTFSEVSYIYTGGVIQDDIISFTKNTDFLILQTNSRYIPSIPSSSVNIAIQEKFNSLTPQRKDAYIKKMSKLTQTREHDMAELCLRNAILDK